MSNASVAAAAAGIPKSTRRAFMASAAAVAAVTPASIASAAEPAADPIFAAIAAWQKADDIWLAKLNNYCEAETACKAENALVRPRIEIELCGVPFAFSSNEEITYFLNTLPNRGASAGENIERMQHAGQRFRDALAAERERVEMVRSKHDIDFLEAHSNTASDVALNAMAVVVGTIPTTLAGIRALAEFMAEPDRVHDQHIATGIASLAKACFAMLPAARSAG